MSGEANSVKMATCGCGTIRSRIVGEVGLVLPEALVLPVEDVGDENLFDKGWSSWEAG